MVEIKSIIANSPAFIAGIRPHDFLISVNNQEIHDVLDYMFYSAETSTTLVILRNGEKLSFDIQKDEYDDIGLEFETFLMDKKLSCRNKCVFCFIDQMPPGMRESLYFKDDDARLSFLQGNGRPVLRRTEEEVSEGSQVRQHRRIPS